MEGWARDGLTIEQIAHNIGVTVTSVYNWKNEHVEFLDAIKKGKEVSDYIVENALFKRACGFEYEETVTEIVEGADGTKKKQVKKVKKYIPPDTGAAAFWLKNRRPDKWRDRPVSDLPEDDALRQYLLQAERELDV